MAFFDDTNDNSNFVVSFTRNPKIDFGVFAKGYTLAANRLSDVLLGAPRFSDYEAYPIVFLYRHALELSLKHVIYSSVQLWVFQFSGDMDDRLHNSHDLAKLSHIALKLLEILFPSDLSIREISRRVDEISVDWCNLDPRSDGYRYPIDRKGQPSTKEHQVVNLRAMMTSMASLLEDLDTIHFGLDIETDRAEEAYVALHGLMS